MDVAIPKHYHFLATDIRETTYRSWRLPIGYRYIVEAVYSISSRPNNTYNTIELAAGMHSGSSLTSYAGKPSVTADRPYLSKTDGAYHHSSKFMVYSSETYSYLAVTGNWLNSSSTQMGYANVNFFVTRLDPEDN